MACRHKFYSELELGHLDYAPETLIVGTFNPAWPAANTAQWFYGRTHDVHGYQSNNFCEVLPRLYGEASLIGAGPSDWKDFCRRRRIAITDLIASIEDADEHNPDHAAWLGGYGDQQITDHFKEFELTPLTQILNHYPSISHIYLTRGAQGFWKRLWVPVQQTNRARTLLTPSDWARIQQRRHNKRNPQQAIEKLPDFITMRWKAAWHF